ncbi:MAG: hypothetical protein ACO1RX_05125 [Candidatus Sericytochromatia bacterium]
MKKALVSIIAIHSLLLVGCGARQNPMMTGMPNVSAPGAATGYTDPYANGAGYASGTGTGYATGTDPYAATNPYGTVGTDPYAANPYGTTPTTGGYGMADPYANGGYGAGAGTGYGAGVNTGYGNGMGMGQPMLDPVTGQPVIDPMTGQPMMVNSVISQQIVTKIQAAGGYRGGKADSAVVDSLKSTSVQQAFGSAPLDHRALAIKSLLDGWTTSEEKSIAQQIWNTILPQQQQTLLGQDAELSNLVTKKLLQGSSNGVGAVLTEIGKLVGLAK